jgi:orotate phosphoribosyltransferase
MLFEMLTSELENHKQRLKLLIENKAYLRKSPLKGEEPFELASGGTSWVLFDCKLVTQNPEGISSIAAIVYEMVKEYKLDGIGGIETGAIPICTAVAQLSFMKKDPIPAFWVRHERKKHGTKNLIEGGLMPNSRVVLMDDVTTRGNSIEEAIKAVRDIGCEIVGLITLVDREEGAKAKLEREGFKFEAIFKKSDFKNQA